MEVKIGVADSPRELVLSSALSPDEIEKLVSDALRHDRACSRWWTRRAAGSWSRSTRIAYVDIAPADTRRVGFVATERRALAPTGAA